MKNKLFLLFIGLFISAGAFAQQGFPFDNEIRAFKHQDSISFPQKFGILFIGSSSIRKWTDLEQRYAGKPIIRRGVGGLQFGVDGEEKRGGNQQNKGGGKKPAAAVDDFAHRGRRTQVELKKKLDCFHNRAKGEGKTLQTG